MSHKNLQLHIIFEGREGVDTKLVLEPRRVKQSGALRLGMDTEQVPGQGRDRQLGTFTVYKDIKH